jgi:aryl-alcohol dehydrogenase-like predicted oxidoreductase
MEYRQLGRSGLRVSALTLGTMTFGGRTFFAKTGNTDVAGARRLIDIAVDGGINMLDTANVYSQGASEEIIGEALGDKRDQLLIATKARFPMGEGPNDRGTSRWHLIRACEASLKRLRTDRIDLYFMHEWDGLTPLEETLRALDDLVRSGKVRYIGCSNYSAWHLMKALGISERLGTERFVSQQIYYSLQGREAEYELVPIALDQGVGIMVWSPWPGACCPASTAAASSRRKAATCRIGASPRSATRSSSTISSTCWWKSPRRAMYRRRRCRWPGCSADPASHRW